MQCMRICIIGWNQAVLICKPFQSGYMLGLAGAHNSCMHAQFIQLRLDSLAQVSGPTNAPRAKPLAAMLQ